MILEGIVTTLSADRQVHIAPMGPLVDEAMAKVVLRPFASAQTYQNLVRHPEGVLHVHDDVLLLARSALGALETLPPLMPAGRVKGFILADACRYYEFRVGSIDAREERVRIEAEVVHAGRFRDFFGFNRAKHAVVEAAILATRTAFLPRDEILAAFKKLAVIVNKTGGPREKEAFAFLQDHVDRSTLGES